MKALPLLVLAAGCVQLAMALVNFALPRFFDYRGNLARLSPIVRQIFVVHSIYIFLVLVIFGLLCVLYPYELVAGTPMARFLCVCLALFWGLRLAIQLFYYDRSTLRQHPLAAAALTLAVIYLALTFTSVAALGVVQ